MKCYQFFKIISIYAQNEFVPNVFLILFKKFYFTPQYIFYRLQCRYRLYGQKESFQDKNAQWNGT